MHPTEAQTTVCLELECRGWKLLYGETDNFTIRNGHPVFVLENPISEQSQRIIVGPTWTTICARHADTSRVSILSIRTCEYRWFALDAIEAHGDA